MKTLQIVSLFFLALHCAHADDWEKQREADKSALKAKLAKADQDAKQKTQIQTDAIFVDLQVMARMPDHLTVARIIDPPYAEPIAIIGMPGTLTAGAKHTSTLYRCGSYEYKIAGGQMKKVEKYAVQLTDAFKALNLK